MRSWLFESLLAFNLTNQPGQVTSCWSPVSFCVKCLPLWAVVRNKGGYLCESVMENVKKQSNRRDSGDFPHCLIHALGDWVWTATSSGPDLSSLLGPVASLLSSFLPALCALPSSFSLFLLVVLVKRVGIDLAFDKCLTCRGSE